MRLRACLAAVAAVVLMMTSQASADVSTGLQGLSALQWQHRIVIGIHAPTEQGRAHAEQLRAQISRSRCLLDARDTLTAVVPHGQAFALGGVEISASDAAAIEGEIRAAIGQAPEGMTEAITKTMTWALIGKDGGIKAAGAGQPDLGALGAQIDSMPMRQREMRDQAAEQPGADSGDC